MTLNETKNKIKEIEDTTKDYQDSINNLQNKLLTLIEDTNKINTSITDDISEDTIVEHSSNASKNIVKNINKSLVKTKKTLDELSTDATKEVKRLVDDYNYSLEEDSEEERLSYVEIKLTSVAGCPDSYEEESTSRNYYGGGDYYPPRESKIDYYFSLLETQELYSKDIPDWEEEVKLFLKENDLEKVIKELSIEGKEIICKLVNGKEYKFKDITNKLDFLKALYAAIEKEMKEKGE